jgi:hypothetical protein
MRMNHMLRVFSNDFHFLTNSTYKYQSQQLQSHSFQRYSTDPSLSLTDKPTSNPSIFFLQK